MGQKVHPKSLRLGYIIDWDSKWFAKPKNFADNLEQDFKIRKFVKREKRSAGIALVGVERAGNYVRVNIHAARPGIIIGKKGADVEELRKNLELITGQKTYVNILEIKEPETNSFLVAEGIALQLEKKIAFRRVMKKAIEKAMKLGALGIKVMVAGRLGGAEIARTEWMKEGRTPLQTFRADIDYGFTEARTTYGQIGVKVWIFKKECFGDKESILLNETNSIVVPSTDDTKKDSDNK